MSDGIARRLGSHWRWRLPLWILTLVSLVYGWMLAGQWQTRMLVSGGGNPAVRLVFRNSGLVIEAYDWKTGKRWPVTELRKGDYPNDIAMTIRAVGGGKAVAWHSNNTLHVVDIAPPHAHRRYVTPILTPADRFKGVTEDENFAVFEREERVSAAGGATVTPIGPTIVHTLVDLRSESVVDTRKWNSIVTFDHLAGQIVSRLMWATSILADEPYLGLWKISAEGKWEKVEDLDPRFQPSELALVLEQNGRWRLLDQNEAVSSKMTASIPVVTRISPSGESALLVEPPGRDGSRTFLINTKSKEVRELPGAYVWFGTGEFVDQGAALLLSDVRDDFRVVDVRTGTTLAVDAAGSQRRNRLLVVAVSLLIASAILLGMGIREKELFWTSNDVVASFIAAQMGVGYLLVSVWHPQLSVVLQGLQWFFSAKWYLSGMFLGAAVMVGIYWTFGRGWLLGRWLLSGACLMVFAIPQALVWEHVQNETDLIAGLRRAMAFGLIFAGVAGSAGWLLRSLGWTTGEIAVVPGNFRQYRLATFFLVITAIAVLIAMGQVLITGPSAVEWRLIVLPGPVIVAGGITLAGILLADAKGSLVAGATACFVFVVAAIIVVHELLTRQSTYQIDIPIALAATVTIAIPCLVLRSRGCRWRRVTSSVATVRVPGPEAAA